jgi:hypothetical protein
VGPRHLVQILLPLYDNDGAPLPHALFAQVRAELVERFGGLTAYNRAPAKGLWKEDAEHVARDDIVVYEVMDAHLDRRWWAAYRQGLAARLRQQELVVRAQAIELL